MKYSEYKAFIIESNDESNQASYRKNISVDEAINILMTKCSKSRKSKIYRGVSSSGYTLCNVIEGQKGGRQSRHTTNYYTVILDELLKEKGSQYPLRSKSIIATSWDAYARDYGDLYCIIPYDDVIIGTLPVKDIWNTELVDGRSITQINDRFEELGIKADSIKGIAKQIESLDDDKFKIIDWLFKGRDDIEGQIRKIYSLDNFGIEFVSASDYETSNGEVWIGGACLMIKYSLYENILRHISSKNFTIVKKSNELGVKDYADEFISVPNTDESFKKSANFNVLDMDKLNIQPIKYKINDKVDAIEFYKYLLTYMDKSHSKSLMGDIISAVDGDTDKYELKVLFDAFSMEFENYFKHFNVDGFEIAGVGDEKHYILKKKLVK